ncbi:hypothetical protein PISMIDRAFT_688600 [Pisolithus microcarpus 441]|uniref:Uncharacterized protein n=1 Tax=Pisolithus microcarpus 441 TaxID=765257 RepID=A0A0C9XMF9_9AGAM|nr:hypothetical protein PISMIDRAFT_688600 [Pisolithus microcarpus 441]
MVKAWGINERGQPSDGGFGFGRFTLLHKGRDSRCAFFQSLIVPASCTLVSLTICCPSCVGASRRKLPLCMGRSARNFLHH